MLEMKLNETKKSDWSVKTADFVAIAISTKNQNNVRKMFKAGWRGRNWPVLARYKVDRRRFRSTIGQKNDFEKKRRSADREGQFQSGQDKCTDTCVSLELETLTAAALRWDHVRLDPFLAHNVLQVLNEMSTSGKTGDPVDEFRHNAPQKQVIGVPKENGSGDGHAEEVGGFLGVKSGVHRLNGAAEAEESRWKDWKIYEKKPKQLACRK